MVVYTEMVRKIWVIGRRTGIRWGYVNRAYWVDTTGRQNIMLVSRMQEESEDRQMFASENTETRQMQQTQAEDGTTLILTEASKESREEFISESRETKHYEEAEVVRGEFRRDLDTLQT